MGSHAARHRLLKTRDRMKLLTPLVRAQESQRVRAVSSSEVLDQLGLAWHRIDDIRWPGKPFADVDHVLVGPAGIFVIDVRPMSKELLDLRPETVTAPGWVRPDVFAGLESAAHAIRSLIGMPHRHAVPVLCLVGESEINRRIDSVIVCSIDHVVATLYCMPPVLNERQVQEIADSLRSSLMPATGRLSALPQQRGL
jgi:hypothetical protein